MASKETPPEKQRIYPKVTPEAEQRLLDISRENPIIVDQTIERLRTEEPDFFRAIGNAIQFTAHSKEEVLMATKVFAETVLLLEIQADIDAEHAARERGENIHPLSPEA